MSVSKKRGPRTSSGLSRTSRNTTDFQHQSKKLSDEPSWWWLIGIYGALLAIAAVLAGTEIYKAGEESGRKKMWHILDQCIPKTPAPSLPPTPPYTPSRGVFDKYPKVKV